MEYYILFNDVDSGLKLYNLLKSAKIKVTISPTPREASKCCGISLLIKNKDDLPSIRECIENNNIEIKDIFQMESKRDPKRDKFC
ncbi:MAG TPA: DUF3343 domain-containing protein [Sedimentibacter sp.]|nr:DUF3343 domain-containing protein [Sedimentibacter sp.]HNZ83553.1 DUF3343 domain-containing protein [Sedimentibacter sp.]HPW99736.1 DUF3343 domain-containing protein [Sedimentibacter sp.]HQB62771.1 DUF3343 domain-containing protein [Sedimentibacter sp.]